MTHVSDDELHNGQLLGIGEASQLCGITSRTLRHYDKLNLLQPDCIGDNKYRYYSLETILRIPIINYLKMMGFSLDEVSELFETQSFDKIKEMLGPDNIAFIEKDIKIRKAIDYIFEKAVIK